MKKILIFIVLVIVYTPNLQAQSGWSVTPTDYQFTMTITGEAIIDCQNNIQANDEVAAFVGGVCRGYIDFGTLVNGNNLAYLIIYSNQSIGESIAFKIYDSSSNTFIDLHNSLGFAENASYGTAAAPYLFTNNYPPTSLNISNVAIFDVSMSGDTVASFMVQDLDSNSYTFSLTNSTGNDNNQFTFVDNQLVLTADVDFVNHSDYVVEVIAVDNLGCDITASFNFSVMNTNEGPYDIFFIDGDNSINENEDVGSLVGLLGVSDSTIIDNHVFTLDTPSAEFSLVGNEVLSEEVFDYEQIANYQIRVRVTDASGNFFIKTLDILIDDVVELDDLKANNIITPNNDGFNDYFTIPNIELFEDFAFTVYNENGNQIYRRTSSAGYNNLWNGRSLDGKELPSGTYYYTLFNPATQDKFVGVINLLRN